MKAVGTLAGYEWQPGPGAKPKFTTKMTTASATLETVKGTKIVCRSGSSTGEVLNAKELRIPSIKFNGCQSSGGVAHTEGAGPEEIVTQDTAAFPVFDPASHNFETTAIRKMPVSAFRTLVIASVEAQAAQGSRQ